MNPTHKMEGCDATFSAGRHWRHGPGGQPGLGAVQKTLKTNRRAGFFLHESMISVHPWTQHPQWKATMPNLGWLVTGAIEFRANQAFEGFELNVKNQFLHCCSLQSSCKCSQFSWTSTASLSMQLSSGFCSATEAGTSNINLLLASDTHTREKSAEQCSCCHVISSQLTQQSTVAANLVISQASSAVASLTTVNNFS